jgi:hypothetical protein
MSEKTKAVNYTAEQTERVREVYLAAEDNDEARAAAVESLAGEMQKKPGSIRAKLVSEKIYQKKTYVSKKGATVETKDKIVATIANLLNVTEAQLGGLEKATKPALELIRAQFVAAQSALAGEAESPDSE